MTESVIDLALGANIVRKDETFAKEMIKTLVETFPSELEQLNAAHDTHAWDTIKDIVHRIKGATAYCGTPRLHEIAGVFLHYLHSTETDNREALYKKFIAEIHAVEDAYKSL